MRRILLWAFPVLLVIAALGIGFGMGWQIFLGPRLRPVTGRVFERTPQREARGDYLVNHVLGCFKCHSPLDPADKRKPAAGLEGSGDVLLESGPGHVVAYNLTPDAETGIGRWTDDEIARAIREGVDRSGHALFMMMPYNVFRAMTDEDLAAVIAYLRSVRAVRHDPGQTRLDFPLRYIVRTMPQPITGAVAADTSTPESKGKYLATLAGCKDCHTPYDDRGHQIAGLEFAGGAIMSDRREGPAITANITPDETGIKGYTQEVFRNVMRTGVSGGRHLDSVMPTYQFAGMTDDDLDAMFVYLRTVKPVHHIVEPKSVASLCRVCNQSHGGGEKN